MLLLFALLPSVTWPVVYRRASWQIQSGWLYGSKTGPKNFCVRHQQKRNNCTSPGPTVNLLTTSHPRSVCIHVVLNELPNVVVQFERIKDLVGCTQSYQEEVVVQGHRCDIFSLFSLTSAKETAVVDLHLYPCNIINMVTFGFLLMSFPNDSTIV